MFTYQDRDAAAKRIREDRVIHLAEHLLECQAKGWGCQVMDTTCTRWDLTHVSPRIREEIEDAAELAELKVEITKVGDNARIRIVGAR